MNIENFINRKFEVVKDCALYAKGTILEIVGCDKAQGYWRFICTKTIDGTTCPREKSYLSAPEFIDSIGTMLKEIESERKNPSVIASVLKTGSQLHVKWLEKASEDDLRAYLNQYDDDKHPDEIRLFNEECRRRTLKDYDSKANGEWI